MGSIVDKLILFICVMCTDILCVCVYLLTTEVCKFFFEHSLVEIQTSRIHSIHPGHLCHLWGLDFKANKWRHKAKGPFFFEPIIINPLCFWPVSHVTFASIQETIKANVWPCKQFIIMILMLTNMNMTRIWCFLQWKD